MCSFFFFFFFPTDRPTFTRGRATGSETFYWDGQNNSVLARYSPHEICGKTLTKLGEIRGRIGFWPPRFLEILARFAAGFWPPRFLEISAGFWPPRSENLGGQNPAENLLDIDECSASPSLCEINAICHNTRGSYYCTCKSGFTGDVTTCQGRTKCFY